MEHQRDRAWDHCFGQRKRSANTAISRRTAVREDPSQGLQHRALSTPEDACSGLADAALMAQSPRSGPVAPLAITADRPLKSPRLPRRRPRFRPRINTVRGSLVEHASGIARLRQHPRIRRRLSHDLPHLELRRARGKGETCMRTLVQQLARLARPGTRRQAIGRRAREAHHRPPPGPASSPPARAALFVPELARGPDRPFRRPSAAAANTGSRVPG